MAKYLNDDVLEFLVLGLDAALTSAHLVTGVDKEERLYSVLRPSTVAK